MHLLLIFFFNAFDLRPFNEDDAVPGFFLTGKDDLRLGGIKGPLSVKEWEGRKGL